MPEYSENPPRPVDEFLPSKETESVKWIIPPEIQKELITGSERILQLIRDNKPEALVVLQRKGELSFTVIQALAEQRQIELPAITYLPIGRSLTDAALPNYDQELSDPEEMDEFIQEQIKIDGSEIHNIAEKAKQELANKKSVLVIDDTKDKGITEATANSILKEAIPVGIDREIRHEYILPPNSKWLSEIVNTTFHLKERQLNGPTEIAVRQLLQNIISGSYKAGEYTNQHGKKIENWEDIATLGKAIKESKQQLYQNLDQKQQVEDPADVIMRLNKSGDMPSVEVLLKLKESFQSTLASTIKKGA